MRGRQSETNSASPEESTSSITPLGPTDVHRNLSLNEEVYDDGQGYYKYMWYGWLRDGAEPDFSAEGDHGQFIYVSPEKNLIIVRNGVEYGADWYWKQWIETVCDFAGEFEGSDTQAN